MSSLYGAGTANAQVYQVPADVTADDQIEAKATTTSSFIDSKEVEAYIRKEFADTPILVDIARCESTFRQFHNDGTVVRGRVNKSDVGVMQINLAYHADTAKKMGLDLYTVEGNAAYGKYLYDKYGSQPWSASEPCWSRSAKDLALK